MNAGYDLLFDNDGKELKYKVHIEDGKVINEEVESDGVQLLTRGQGGEGMIRAEELGKTVRFKPPENELAIVVRRDSLQHPFIEPLHEWASGVRHFTFGASLGKDCFAVFVKDSPDVDDRDTNQVIGIFQKAKREFGEEAFGRAIIRDMAEMGFEIDAIMLNPFEGIQMMKDGVPTELMGLGVREPGIAGIINQNEISQGMFRALSVIIQVNYSQMARRANCILIDDVGEGLDFDRSVRLIELIRKKARESSFQLIMATNDQFVMNHVPLREWSILQRKGNRLTVRNDENSHELFEEFRFLGMSNFTFFEMDYVNGTGPS